MRTVFILSILLLSVTFCSAQTPDSAIEVRLELLHQPGGSPARSLALGVSIINHQDRDIYIPSFELFSSFAGIHYYQLEADGWKELDLFTHDYYKPMPVHSSHGGTVADTDPPVYFLDNEISTYYKKTGKVQRTAQDSILRAFCRSNGQNIKYWTAPGYQPLFLRARQELHFYKVYDLEYLSGKKGEYRISFNTEKRDGGFRYSDSVSDGLLKRLPDRIFQYGLYTPRHIVSNVLYYSSVEIQ